MSSADFTTYTPGTGTYSLIRSHLWGEFCAFSAISGPHSSRFLGSSFPFLISDYGFSLHYSINLFCVICLNDKSFILCPGLPPPSIWSVAQFQTSGFIRLIGTLIFTQNSACTCPIPLLITLHISSFTGIQRLRYLFQRGQTSMTTHVLQILPFPWQGGHQCSLQILAKPWICAPGTRYSWVDWAVWNMKFAWYFYTWSVLGIAPQTLWSWVQALSIDHMLPPQHLMFAQHSWEGYFLTHKIQSQAVPMIFHSVCNYGFPYPKFLTLLTLKVLVIQLMHCGRGWRM